MKKTKLWLYIINIIICVIAVISCSNQGQNDFVYKPIIPTSAELDEIVFRLDDILSTQFENYNSDTGNAYEKLFSYNRLGFTVPNSPEELQAMMEFSDNGTVVYENDPLGYFGEVTEVIRDEAGCINTDALETGTLIGYQKYSGRYIDFLAEGVWNGKLNHDSLMIFDDGTKCYYYNGYYYLPEETTAVGGGIFHSVELQSVSPVDDNKYEVLYTVIDDMENAVYDVSAILGMKETQNGFRFWSVYSMDVDSMK